MGHRTLVRFQPVRLPAPTTPYGVPRSSRLSGLVARAEAEFRTAWSSDEFRAEFAELMKRPNLDRPVNGFRSLRDFYAWEISRRLASPLYGGLVSVHQARSLIGV